MRPASLKNRTQRKDVRQTINQVTEERGTALDLDATEMIGKPTSVSKTEGSTDGLKERVPKSTGTAVTSKRAKGRQAEKPAPKPAPKSAPKAKPTTKWCVNTGIRVVYLERYAKLKT